MGWLKDAEYMRDYGHTWGPGHEKEDYEEDIDTEDEETGERRKQLQEDITRSAWYAYR